MRDKFEKEGEERERKRLSLSDKQIKLIEQKKRLRELDEKAERLRKLKGEMVEKEEDA